MTNTAGFKRMKARNAKFQEHVAHQTVDYIRKTASEMLEKQVKELEKAFE